MSIELTLNVPGSTWTDKDWEKSVPKFIPERIMVVPVRHPDNDDTWSVAVYDPTQPPLGIGHRLRGILVRIKCATFEDAEHIVGWLRVTPETVTLAL